MTYYEIRDRVPCEEIDALTVAAARVWLERNGWTLCDSNRGVGVEYEDWWRGDGDFVAVAVSPEKTRDHGQRMAELVSEVVLATGKRVAGVIAEICAIAKWQKRCAEWAEPKPVQSLTRELCERFLLPCGRHYAERPKWRSPYDLRLGVQCEQCGDRKERK